MGICDKNNIYIWDDNVTSAELQIYYYRQIATLAVFEISNGIAVQILEVTGRERVMLLFDVIIPVPHCTKQWIYRL